ncbi:MAG: hypothetical protein IT362_11360 [Deltaproteobacteria bacterium]|nr:hypothetical protein [Deltaproteobacteria bacterium]
MKKLMQAVFLTLFLTAIPVFAATEHGRHDHGDTGQVVAATSTESGIKATLKVNRSNSMVDLYLADAGTGASVTSGKVFAKIKLPNGKTVEKELMGMKMGQEYSFMNSLDLSLKGKYVFDISVTAEGKNSRFDFMYTAK